MLSFSQLEGDYSGDIELQEFKTLFSKNTPIDKIQNAFNKLDKNKNGKLDRKEYMMVKAVPYAQALPLPKYGRLPHKYKCTLLPIFQIDDKTDEEKGDHRRIENSTLEVPLFPTERSRVPSFSQVDGDKSGTIDLEEFKSLFSRNTPIARIQKAFNKLDKDKNGKLDRKEYMKVRAVSRVQALMLPKDGRIEHEYNCTPPPIFMIVITAIELGMFVYHYFIYVKQKERTLHKYGPAFVDSPLIFDPSSRHEVWRYLSYMFVHTGYMHLLNNIVMQVFLGFLLELVHKWWRLLIIYLSGVLLGSLATYIFNPTYYLAGASGGVYALMFAHISTVILNWPQMQRPYVRVILFSLYASYDIGVAVYYNYILEEDTHIGYAAHIGGGIAGLLTGIIVLKNLEQKKWEAIVWWISLCCFLSLSLFAIVWNIFV